MLRTAMRHWDRFAFGVSAALCVAAAPVYAFRRPDPVVEEAERLTGALQSALAASVPVQEGATHAGERVSSVFGPPAAARPGDEWVFYRRPDVRVRAHEAPAAPVVRFQPPGLAEPVAGIGVVKLAWEEAAGNTASPAEWVVLRRAAGGTDFDVLVRLPAATTSYEDRSVSPRTTYAYIIEEEPGVPAQDEAAFSGQRPVAVRSEIRTVRTPGVVRLELAIVDAGRNPPEATVRVRRLDSGKSRTRQGVKAGDEVDGCRVVSFRQEEDPSAPAIRLRGAGGSSLTRRRPWVMTYLDEDGVERQVKVNP
jgi:hypothetical protein